MVTEHLIEQSIAKQNAQFLKIKNIRNYLFVSIFLKRDYYILIKYKGAETFASAPFLLFI